MCGRARPPSDVSEIKIAFGIPADAEYPGELGSGADRSGAGRVLRLQGRRPPPWGDALGPDPVLGQGYQDQLLDHQRPRRGGRHQAGFPGRVRQRRCLLPLDSFYEWKKTASGKQPYAIALKDRKLPLEENGFELEVPVRQPKLTRSKRRPR